MSFLIHHLVATQLVRHKVTNVNPNDEQPRTNTSDLVTIETPDALLNMSHPHSKDPNSGHVTNENQNNEQPTSDKTIKLFHQNQMTFCYKQTEKNYKRSSKIT